MKIYLIEAENNNSSCYLYPFEMFRTVTAAREFVKNFVCDAYYIHINIKCFELNDQDILFEFLKFMQRKPQVYPDTCNFPEFYEKVGKVVCTIVIK